MKGLAFSALAGILIASISLSTYADSIPITVVNESSAPVVLMIKPNSQSGRVAAATPSSVQEISIAAAAIKMFTGRYTYSMDDFFIQSVGHPMQQCKFASAPIAPQAPKLITLNISNDPSTRGQNCLVSWQ